MKREEQIANAAYDYIKSDAVGAEYTHLAFGDFINGAKWADSHPHWIPVEDYPKVDISCTLLVHYVDGTIDICDYYGDYYDYTGENVTRNVTHWMPLPQPPRKED